MYHLPEHVQPHVDFVTPSVHFGAKLNRRSGDESAATRQGIRQSGPHTSLVVTDAVSGITGELRQCDNSTTPICLRTLYDFFYNPVATDKNSFGIGQCTFRFHKCICYKLHDLPFLFCFIAEYTPQAYLKSDLEMFARNYSTDLIGKEPKMVSIDGGEILFPDCGAMLSSIYIFLGYIQTTNQSFDTNGESNLDFQYGMSLVTGKQNVTLYQIDDGIASKISPCVPSRTSHNCCGADSSFNDFLDAIDGSYCTFDGGDDPTQDGTYPDPQPGGYKGMYICLQVGHLFLTDLKVPRIVGL